MSNPSPYDDLGWTYPMMRNIVIDDGQRQGAADGGDGAGDRRRCARRAASPAPAPTIIVEHTGDNLLAQFRFQFATREDVGGRGGVRSGRPEVRRRRVHHPEREPRAARAGADATSACPAFAVASVPADREARTTSTCRASATSTAGATRRTKAGCARRSTTTRFRTPTSARTKSRSANLQREFDVILWPHGGGVGQDPPTDRHAGSVPEVGGVPGARLSRIRRRTRAAASDSPGSKKLYEFVQAGGTLITEGGTSSIFPTNYPDAGHHDRSGQRPVGARLGLSRRRRRSDEPDRLRHPAQSPAGLLQDERRSALQRRRPARSARGGAGDGRARRRPRRRQLPEHAADGREPERVRHVGSDEGLDGRGRPRPAPAAQAGGGGRGGRWRWRRRRRRRGGRSAAAAAVAAAPQLLDFLQPRVILRSRRRRSDMLLSGGVARRREPREPSAGHRRARSARATS